MCEMLHVVEHVRSLGARLEVEMRVNATPEEEFTTLKTN